MENKPSNYLIYRAVNTKNGKSYIGATSKSIEERTKDHLRKAIQNSGSYFQEAIGTYGPDSFIWEQIDTATNPNELAKKEHQYILEYKSKEEGYNKDSGGGFSKIVYQYCMETGKLLNSFKTLQEAADSVGAYRTSISNACLGYNKSCKGYYWSYEDLEKLVMEDKRTKCVCKYTLTGELITKYDSVSQASKKTGLSRTCIARVCRGERRHSGGFKWKYS